MIRVLIVDDHTIVRKGVYYLLEEPDDIQVVGEAGNAEEMFHIIREKSCDVVLLDISLPGRSGIDALKQLKKTNPEMAVLILSMYPEDQYALRVMKSGASGYLTKESVPEELIRAIRRIYKGKRYISAGLAEELANHVSGTDSELPHKQLSDREYEVMMKIVSGESLTQIAEELSLSIKTISTYRSRILDKMNKRNNSELIKYVIEHKLQ